MPSLPDSQHTTAHAIVRWYESKPQEHRPHMGASIIGHPCERSSWLTWRWASRPQFSGRILRLFDTGKREEARLLEELRGIGATVWDTDPSSGDQWRVSACNGHFGGSLDGVAKGLPEAPKSVAVLEFKTHSSKSYGDLVKNKVQASKPQHYDQMTVYMGLMEIDRALYMAVNKDTDDVYTEWVHFDADRFAILMDRAQRLIELTVPPERISDDPTYFVCKMCSHYEFCHKERAAEANCRSCCHVSPVENGQWRCSKHNALLDHKIQLDGCKEHLMIPTMVTYAEAIDGGESWVAYRHKATGNLFVNGTEEVKDYGPVFSSKELHNCPGGLIGEASEAKNILPGTKVVPRSTVSAEMDWDAIATDPNDLPVRPEKPTKAEEKRKIKETLQALEATRK